MDRAAWACADWAFRYGETLKGHRHAKDPLLRASRAIPLNSAEGHGQPTHGDRRRYVEMARNSALRTASRARSMAANGAVKG